MENLMKNQQKICLDKQESYKCNICNDLTFILNDNEATPCKCKSLREVERVLKNSGISEEFRRRQFDNFDYSKNKEILNAYVMAKSYANKFDEVSSTGSHSIIFMGKSGSGKTHLSLAIANHLMSHGVGVLYMSYRECITSIKQSIMDSENYNRAMSRYKNAKVLLIDDLFKGSITPSDINIMFEIVNYRYLNKKPMIISTEKYVNDLLSIDEALGSRIIEMCAAHNLELKGKRLNYRLEVGGVNLC